MLALQELGYQHVDAGQLVIHSMDAFAGAVGIADSPGKCTPEYIICEPRSAETVPGYFANALRLAAIQGYIEVACQAVRERAPRLRYSTFGDMLFAVPTASEQASIARFISHIHRLISRFSQAQRRRLSLLEDQVINTALAAMRRPDVTVQRLSRVCTQRLRPIERSPEQSYVALGLKNRGRGIFHKSPRVGNELGDSEFFGVKPGDLVISGQFAWEGAVAIASPAERECIVSHRYYLLRGIEGIATTEYLHALLRSDFGAMLLDQHSRGAAGRNRPLNIGTLLKENVPVPPYRVQLELGDLVLSLSPIRDRIERQLDRLRELRTRLIADVVTGKLDVREAATRLPEEIEQPDEGDELETEDDIEESSEEVDAVATRAEA